MSEKKTVKKKPVERKSGALLEEIYYLIGFIGFCCLIASIWLGLKYVGYGVLLFVFAIFLSGIKFVPRPYKWVIEQFGAFKRNLEPGLNYVVPFLESIRAEILVADQSIPIFVTKPEIDFRDGTAGLKDPKLYCKPREDKPELTVYKVADWRKWVEDAVESIFLGFLNTLSIHDALDQGMARGNLIDRLIGAPDFTQKQIDTIGQAIKDIQQQIDEDGTTTAMARLLEIRKQEKETEKTKLEALLKNQKMLLKDFNKMKNQAKERGIEILRIVVADYELDESVVKARQAPLEARLAAEAAVFDAMKEATMRTEPIRLAQERFMKLGLGKKRALEKAFELEIMETLAKTGSLFLTGGGQGTDIKSIVARLAGIAAASFVKVTETIKAKEEKKRRSQK